MLAIFGKSLFGKRASAALVAAGPALNVGAVSTPADLERLEGGMLALPQVETPVTHHFAPGLYGRECAMPAGTCVLGQEHVTKHLNIVLAGRARVEFGGGVRIIKAGDVFVSEAGARKIFFVEEALRFLTLHPTDETDPQKLEDVLVRKTETYLAHQAPRSLSGVITP